MLIALTCWKFLSSLLPLPLPLASSLKERKAYFIWKLFCKSFYLHCSQIHHQCPYILHWSRQNHYHLWFHLFLHLWNPQTWALTISHIYFHCYHHLSLQLFQFYFHCYHNLKSLQWFQVFFHCYRLQFLLLLYDVKICCQNL